MLNIPEGIKKQFKISNVKKNIRISFPNGERADITNENLIAESLSFTESVCSKESLTFGLCESSVLEFETAGVENIKDMVIEAYIEINASGAQFLVDKENGIYKFDILNLFCSRLPANTNVKFSLEGSGGIEEIVAWSQPGSSVIMDSVCFDEGKEPTECTWSVGFAAEYFMIHTTSDFSGSVYASIEGDMFYPVPLGKFIVDSSQKQADMSRRKVTAYGITTSALYTYSPIEKAKRDVTCSKNNDYIIDMEKFFISNITGDYIPENASMVEVETIDSNSGYGSHVRVNDKVLSILTEEADKTLYYQPCTMTQAKIDELREQIKDAVSMAVYIGHPSWAEDVLADIDRFAEQIYYPTMDYYGAGNYGFVGSLKGGYRYIYPYNNSGISYSETYRTIRIPVSVTIYDPYGKAFETFTFCSDADAKLYKVTLEDSLEISMSVKREKDADSKYYSVNSNLPVLADTIEAFLEFQGRFGMHDRSGAFTTLKLADRFANKTSISKSEYSDLWYEDKQSYPYGIVSAIYVNEKGEESFSCVNIVKDVDILEKVEVATATPTSGTTVSLSFDKADVEGYYIESPYPIVSVNLSFSSDSSAWLEPFEIESGTTAFLLTNEIFEKSGGSLWNDTIDSLDGIYLTFEALGEYSGAFVVSSCKPSNVYYKADECILYDLSGNYLIQNCTFTQEQMDTILNSFAESIKDIQYMPCEVELVGLPYIESGDVVEIETDAGSFTTIVERRTLNGIQALRDSWESQASDDHIATSESSGSFGGGSSGGGGGGTGAVASVNGYTGNVVLKTSDLTNDSNYVSDSNYVHTDNNFTAAYKANVDSNTSARHTHSNKSVLDGITSALITSWNNKVDKVDGKGLSTNDYTTTEKNKLAGIDSGANKYTLPTASSTTLGGVKTTSSVTSNSGYTPCPIIAGVPYYKEGGGGGGDTTIRYDSATDWIQLLNASGTWQNWKRAGLLELYILENGIVNYDVLKSFSAKTWNTPNANGYAPTLSFVSNAMKIEFTCTGTWRRGSVFTDDLISFAGKSKLFIKLSGTRTGSALTVDVVLGATETYGTSFEFVDSVSILSASATSVDDTLEWNISNLSGSYYLAFYIAIKSSSVITLNIEDIWLE